MKNSIKICTMKKLVLILIGLLFSYISFSQEEKREMSNYEKYVLAKEQAASQDTVYKTDTVLVGEEKREWDDLYYTPSKDQLKLKSKELRLRKKEIRMEQDSLYYDAKQEVYNDLSYTAQIYRFHRPYYFPYYSYYWEPYYDPWFLDSWYYGYSWYYPYYGFSFSWSWGYPYYHNHWYYGYHNWYWDYPRYYSYNNYNYNNYYSFNNRSNIPYGRRERPSNYTTSTVTRREPVTINRTVQIDRNTGRTLSVTQENRRTSSPNLQRIDPVRRTTTTQNLAPKDKPSYDQVRTQERRTYTPSYEQPRMSTRPQYNNTRTSTPSVNQNRSYEQRSYTPSTERRTISTQSQTQTRSSVNRSSNYSAPSRSNYSTPSRSYNSGSSYSSPSRSYNSGSNSGSSYSGGSRSSGSSYSGGSSGSSSGGSSRSSSSGSSSGRR